MRKISSYIVPAILAAMLFAPAAVSAKEYNKRQHVGPQQGAKIQRAIANSWMLQATQGGKRAGGQDDVTNTGCGGINLGNIQPGAEAPRDQVIVIQGDVINAPRNCR